jgi:type IV pilus assembly protein PilQ
MIKFAVKNRFIFVFFLFLASTLYAQDVQKAQGQEELIWPEEEEQTLEEPKEEQEAQEPQEEVQVPQEAIPVATIPETKPKEPAAVQTAVIDNLAEAQKVTLDFKEADIRNVLKIISYKAGVNIIATPEVIGDVSIRLVEVHWEKALDAILKTYGFAYEKQGNIILVAPIEKLTAMKKQEVELQQVQPTLTEVFNLKYVDSLDAKKTLEPQLSKRGKITILEMTGQAGWEFGDASDVDKRRRIEKGRVSRSKTLVISDIQPVLDKIREVIQEIDKCPQQIFIEAKIIEVNHDKLRDIGFTWGTGSDGITSLSTTRLVVDEYHTYIKNATTGEPAQTVIKDISPLLPVNLNSEGSQVWGANFIPASEAGEFLFQKLTGTEFEALFRAIETKADGNILSAPHVMTLNNQEASILVGERYPLLKSSVSTETGAVIGTSFDRYQNIGIQLNVVPQLSGNDNINLILHPAVSSYSQTVKAMSATGVTMAEYPIILTREADTQVLVKNGETVVIGGLITDTKTVEITGIPILKDLPLIGILFRKQADLNEKIDLLIFITTRIVQTDEFSPEEINRQKERLNRDSKDQVITQKKKKEGEE